MKRSRDAQLDRPGAGLPIAVAVALASRKMVSSSLRAARLSARRPQLHQSPIISRIRSASGAFSTSERRSIILRPTLSAAEGSSVVSLVVSGLRNPTLTQKSPVTAASPLTRYGALTGSALASGLASACYTTPGDTIR